MLRDEHRHPCGSSEVAHEIERGGVALLRHDRRRDLEALGMAEDVIQEAWLRVVRQPACIVLDGDPRSARKMASWRCNRLAGEALKRRREREQRESSFDAYRALRSDAAFADLRPADESEQLAGGQVDTAEDAALALISFQAAADAAPWDGAEGRISTDGMRMSDERRAVAEHAAHLVVLDLQRDPLLRVAWELGLAHAAQRVRGALVAVDPVTFTAVDPTRPGALSPSARQDLYGTHPSRLHRVVGRVVDAARGH